jgi:chromosome segregation ATPase
VPIANSDLQCDKSVSDNQGIGHGKEVNNLDLSNGAPALFVTSSDASTQTEVDLQSIATQKEKEIDLQHIETQTEVSSQQIGGLISDNCMLMGENAELMELNERLEYGIILSLRNKLEEKEQENVKLQAELNQTKEELTSMLKEMEKRLQSMHEKKEGLEENLRNIKEAMKRGEKQLMIVKGDNEALCESNNKLQSIKEQRDQEKARLQAKLAQKNEELSSLQEENKQEYESMSEVIKNLREILKIVSTENEELKKDVRFFEEDAEEGCILMQKREKRIKSLEFQMQELENELEFVKRKKEQFKEEAEDEIDGLGLQEESEVDGLEWETVPLNLTSDEFDVFELVRKNEELNRKLKELKEIIEGTAQTICRMECESQSDKEEVKCLKDQIEALDKNTCHEQRKFNDQFYTITPNVFNSSPPKKRKFSESSNDSAYNSDDEDGSLFCSSVMERVSHQQMYGKKCKGEC